MSLVIWEIWSYLQVPVFWYLFKRHAGRDISGELVAGALFGLFIEFSTEPLWTYHFALTFYKDIPVSVPLGWGVMFSLVLFASERLYLWALDAREIEPADRRVLLCDLAAGVVVGLPLEAVGVHAGVWDYNAGILGWSWGTIPLFDMPYEALAGYALLMLVAPSFVRHWRRALSPVEYARACRPVLPQNAPAEQDPLSERA